MVSLHDTLSDNTEHANPHHHVLRSGNNRAHQAEQIWPALRGTEESLAICMQHQVSLDNRVKWEASGSEESHM